MQTTAAIVSKGSFLEHRAQHKVIPQQKAHKNKRLNNWSTRRSQHS